MTIGTVWIVAGARIPVLVTADADCEMKELDTVVLRRELSEFGLEAGDVGAVVDGHTDDSYEVEFVSGKGGTVAVAPLPAGDPRPIDSGEILHVRSLAHN